MFVSAGRGFMRGEKWGFALLVAIVLGAVTVYSFPPRVDAGGAATSPPSIKAVWVELGPAGATIARAVTAGTRCPRLALGAQSYAMQARAQPAPPDFPGLVCEMMLPPGATSAVVDDLSLPLPKATPCGWPWWAIQAVA
jgi:hypothetical protein